MRTPRFGLDQLCAQLTGEARDNLVLHVEEIGHGLVEALGPKMIAGLGVDELHVHAHPIAAALHRTFKDVTHAQLAADLLHIDMFAFVSESRVAADHERAADARQICGQALGDAINEILLLGIAADIGEGQNNDREAGRRWLCGSDVAAFACAGTPTCNE